MIDYSEILIQENKISVYIYHYQQTVYSAADINCLIWCGNSSDLNVIESAYPYLKRQITKKNAPTSQAVAEERWKQA